jgi:hypothetical protein
MTNFTELAEQWRPLRDKVEEFIETRIYPVEQQLDDVDNARYFSVMRPLMADAKARGIWALGHP